MSTPDYMLALEEDAKGAAPTTQETPVLSLFVLALCGVLSACMAALGLSLYLLSTSAVYTPEYSMACLSKFNSATIQPEQLRSCLIK